MNDERFRALPAVDALVEGILEGPHDPGEQAVLAASQGVGDEDGASRVSRALVVEAARQVLKDERDALMADASRRPAEPAERVARVRARARELSRPRQERVINATGVILHTNLGRAPLSLPAQKALAAAARGYSALEYDVPRGRRSERAVGVEEWLVRLTGAEAALAVNNGAAAVLLGVSALAQGRQVLVSRGELVEIGGSFRLPEILAKAGATLVEVGTTNRTRIDDYRNAMGPGTALVLRVHPSNFRVIGFHERPALGELTSLAREAGVPLLDDLGSGALIDTKRFGLEHEPTIKESLTEGADLVTFSGDKLLGGPQAGLVVGRRKWIERLKRDPLARALRVDKLIIAALEATLPAYFDPTRAEDELPALAMLGASIDALRAHAERMRAALADVVGLEVDVIVEASEVGGGALPGARLPTAALALTITGGNAAGLEERLRRCRPPLIARIRDDRVLLDARTLLFEDADEIARLVRAAVQNPGP